MSVKPATGNRKVSLVSVSEPSSSLKALAVGDSEEWLREGYYVPADGVAFVAFSDIDENVLKTLSPTIVLSPLLANAFDCIDLALLLSKLGYTGRYHAFSQNVPKPNVIEREVRQLCPKLTFKIIDSV